MADAAGHEPPVSGGASAGQSQTIILASGAACTDMAGTEMAKKRLDEE